VSAVYESEVVRIMRAFKRDLLRAEAEQERLLAHAYLDVQNHLADKIEALSEQLARLAAEGKDVPYWQMARLERWQRLQAQTLEELARFNGYALSQIRDEQLRLGVLGVQHAQAALESMKPGISLMLDRLDIGAFRTMVGLAGDGSPLAALLDKAGRGVLDAMRRELQRSIALGRNPRVTAAAVRKATGMGLQRALTIARTEQLRVYREATLETFRAFGVTRYERICAYDDRTCIGCLSAAGEIVSSEFAIDDHPRGRCSAVPIIPGIDNPVMESGQSWFDRQDDVTKLHIMGPGRLAAYRSGLAGWKDLATHTHDATWGGAWIPTPVSKLVAGRTPAAA
jgi:hypothetical protein